MFNSWEHWKRDLVIVSAIVFGLNLTMAILGKISIWDFLMYTSIIGYCDFVVALYVQFRFETTKKMVKMVDSVEDLIKKLAKKKGKKRLAKALKKEIEEAKVAQIVEETK
jgi:uncharacterized membrane protein YuzA (DUF378 family)